MRHLKLPQHRSCAASLPAPIASLVLHVRTPRHRSSPFEESKVDSRTCSPDMVVLWQALTSHRYNGRSVH